MAAELALAPKEIATAPLRTPRSAAPCVRDVDRYRTAFTALNWFLIAWRVRLAPLSPPP